MLETIFITDNKWESNIEINSIRSTSSTFNIPSRLCLALEQKKKEHGKIGSYLQFLLRKYHIVIYSGSLPKSVSIKKKYQPRNQEMKALSFRPKNEDWLELKVISDSYVYSMSYIFILLLELDCSDFGEAIERAIGDLVPTVFAKSHVRLRQFFNKKRRILTKRLNSGSPLYRLTIRSP